MRVSARHPDECIVMVIDGAGWHRSDALRAPGNSAFDSLDALEDQLALALNTLKLDPGRISSIVSWPWINVALITSFMN